MTTDLESAMNEIADFRSEIGRQHHEIHGRHLAISGVVREAHEFAGNAELGKHVGRQVDAGLMKAANAIAVADYELKRAFALAKMAAEAVEDANRRRDQARRRMKI